MSKHKRKMIAITFMAAVFRPGLLSPCLFPELFGLLRRTQKAAAPASGSFLSGVSPQKFGLEIPPFIDQAAELVLLKRLAQWTGSKQGLWNHEDFSSNPRSPTY